MCTLGPRVKELPGTPRLTGRPPMMSAFDNRRQKRIPTSGSSTRTSEPVDSPPPISIVASTSPSARLIISDGRFSTAYSATNDSDEADILGPAHRWHVRVVADEVEPAEHGAD